MSDKQIYQLISVIIPAYNEEAGIGQVLQDLTNEPVLQHAEIIVVNDGSTDNTAAIVADFDQVVLINRRHNRGYGASIAKGIRAATRPFVIWYDADGQHRVEDLLNVAEVLVVQKLDYCIGTRDERSHEVASRKFGKFVLRKAIQFATNKQILDFNSGMRGFRTDMIKKYLNFFPKGFGASTVTTLLIAERDYEGVEVPIVVKERIGTSQVKQIRDGLRTLLIVLRVYLLFKPLRFFGAIGSGCIILGSMYGFWKAFTLGRGFPVFGMLVVLMGIQALFFGLLADQLSMARLDNIDR